MKRWRDILALTFAGVLITSSALAQGTTATPPRTGASPQAEKAKDAPTTGDEGKSGTTGAKGDMKTGAKAGGNRQQVKAAQEALKEKGFDPGPADGMMGPRTRAALREFQKKEGIQTTGRLDAETMSKLGVSGQAGAAADTGTPAASPQTGTGASGGGSKSGAGSSGAMPGPSGSGGAAKDSEQKK